MKVTFVGVGEACDERYPNTSILVETEDLDGGVKTILLDCGFSVPFHFWRYESDPNKLDGIWISHFHGDHFLGLPLLLLRFWEMKRSRPLLVVGQKGITSLVERAIELAYPGLSTRFTFELRFHEVVEGDSDVLLSLQWQYASTEHSQRNLSLSLGSTYGKLFYSGDGKPTSESTALASGSLLLIHEAFRLTDAVSGHGTVQGVIEMAYHAHASSLACVHIQRDVRRESEHAVRQLLARHNATFRTMLPLPGDVVTLAR